MKKLSNKKKIYVGVMFLVVIAMIVAGIMLIFYPINNKNNTKEAQKELVQKVKDEILNNANNVDNTSSDEFDKNIEKKDINIADIEFEENESDSNNASSQTSYANKEVKGIIEIKKLDLMFAIVEGANKSNLSIAICHIPATSEIGQKGNCVLAGHRGGIYGQFFKYINKLSKGDEVVLTDLSGKEYTYKVYESEVVMPTDTYICNDIEDKDTLTMVTCENRGKKRLVVRAELQNKENVTVKPSNS